jgi:hypothetical protein
MTQKILYLVSEDWYFVSHRLGPSTLHPRRLTWKRSSRWPGPGTSSTEVPGSTRSISLKRSTRNLQLSTSCRPITPSFGGKVDIG